MPIEVLCVCGHDKFEHMIQNHKGVWVSTICDLCDCVEFRFRSLFYEVKARREQAKGRDKPKLNQYDD